MQCGAQLVVEVLHQNERSARSLVAHNGIDDEALPIGGDVVHPEIARSDIELEELDGAADLRCRPRSDRQAHDLSGVRKNVVELLAVMAPPRHGAATG